MGLREMRGEDLETATLLRCAALDAGKWKVTEGGYEVKRGFKNEITAVCMLMGKLLQKCLVGRIGEP